MPSTLAYYFTRNQNVDWGNCDAAISDQISSEVVASFSGAEIGKKYNVNVLVRTPSGTQYYLASPYHIVGAGTETFVTNLILNVQVGTYQIMSVVYNQGV